ncbi:Uu.00g117670.m01.CDS01 [Anthostomella pinea]|uniref:Uu.00g117670.m01.CDS01 n=1 Tax=Anthostomella pinea TaxID=933095 RepID=A0AAI8VG62_9PEZI|nr:Uu.00g117670.m01.CDS01 [Anthostomella pinea]
MRHSAGADGSQAAIQIIESLRSNLGGNSINDYDIELEGGEFLTSKIWLDIVKSGPLPLLKLTLKPRMRPGNNSLALILFSTKEVTTDGLASTSSQSARNNDAFGALPESDYKTSGDEGEHENLDPRNRSLIVRAPGELQIFDQDDPEPSKFQNTGRNTKGRLRITDKHSAHGPSHPAYPLDSFTGALVKVDDTPASAAEDATMKTLIGGFGGQSEPTLVGSLGSRQENDSRRILDLNSNGGKPDEDGRVRVWDYLIDAGDADEVIFTPSATGHDAQSSPCGDSGSLERQPHRVERSEQSEKQREPQLRTHGVIFAASKSSDDALPQSAKMLHPDGGLYILEYRKKAASKLVFDFFTTSRSLLEMFIPINFEHDTTKKNWGGMSVICQVMDTIFTPKVQLEQPAYFVQNYADDVDLREVFSITAPSKAFDGCTGCSKGFKSYDEGVIHLKTMHFSQDPDHAFLSRDQAAGFFIRAPDQIQVETRINDLTLLVRKSESFISTLCEKAEELRLGATRSEGDDTEQGYPVMERLVRVFESVTLLIVLTARMVSKVDLLMRQTHRSSRHRQNLAAKPIWQLHKIHAEAQKHLEHLEHARIDIILASKTDSRAGRVTLTSIGPEFMISLISNGLFLRRLKGSSGESVDVCESYKQHTTSLQLQVNQRPQKRLFADMYALEEELDILRRVIHWQRKFCSDIMRVLDPTSHNRHQKH